MKNANEYNSLDLTIDLFEKVLRLGGAPSVPALVEDVLDALQIQNKHGAVPVCIRRDRSKTGWEVAYRLPPGLTQKNFEDIIPHLTEATGASIIDIKSSANIITLEIHTVPLPNTIPFNFDPRHFPKMTAPFPVGVGPRGLIVVDLAKIPHLFVGGTTGGGKSNTVISLVCSLLLRSPKVQVCVIDRKKTDYNFLGNRIKLATSETEAYDLLCMVRQEMQRRQDLFRGVGIVKWSSYKLGDLPYLVLVIDELAQIREQRSQEVLLELLQLARSAGISIVAATQRPSSTMFSKMPFGDFKALFGAVIAMKTRDAQNSRMILDNPLAANIVPNPGRCIFQWETEGEQLQAMFLPVDPEDKPKENPGDYRLAEEVIQHVGEVEIFHELCSNRLPTR